MKKFLLVMLLLWGGGLAGFWYWYDGQSSRTSFRTAAIRRGDLHSTINATGTIEPWRRSWTKAQVAGEVLDFGPDPSDPSRLIRYGSHVEKGTVLAHLDPRLFQARVDQARASLEKAEADVLQAEAKLRQALDDDAELQDPVQGRRHRLPTGHRQRARQPRNGRRLARRGQERRGRGEGES